MSNQERLIPEEGIRHGDLASAKRRKIQNLIDSNWKGVKILTVLAIYFILVNMIVNKNRDYDL